MGKDSLQRGDISVCILDSLCCASETKTAL